MDYHHKGQGGREGGRRIFEVRERRERERKEGCVRERERSRIYINRERERGTTQYREFFHTLKVHTKYLLPSLVH